MSLFVWWAVAFLTLLTLAKIVDGLRAMTLAISEARLDQQTIRLATLHAGRPLAGAEIQRRWL